jgi:mannose-1-phosphate guanylyltransferase
LPSISIDYGVMEHARDVLVVSGDFGWSDVGSWAAVHRMMRQDENGNAGNGRWLGMNAKNCLVHGGERLVVLLGVQDAVVVDTPDALLVADLKRSQDVRELVDELKQKGYDAYTIK